jgi:hypothetical protein
LTQFAGASSVVPREETGAFMTQFEGTFTRDSVYRLEVKILGAAEIVRVVAMQKGSRRALHVAPGLAPDEEE